MVISLGSLGKKENSGLFISSNGAGTGLRGWKVGAGEMESSCPGQGGSATGHRSHFLTLPVLAAQSPVGLKHAVEEGRDTGFSMFL